MEAYLNRIEKKVDDPFVSIELLDDMETVIAEGNQESIFYFKQLLLELISRVWHWELRAKKIGNWEECEYYYRLSCQLRELLHELELKDKN